MTIQTIKPTPVSTRNLLIQSISAILTRAVESKEAILVTEVASQIAAAVEPTEDDVERIHSRVRRAIDSALDVAGLMSSQEYRRECLDDYEWANEVAFVVSEELRRLPSDWRDELDADRAKCAEREVARIARVALAASVAA